MQDAMDESELLLGDAGHDEGIEVVLAHASVEAVDRQGQGDVGGGDALEVLLQLGVEIGHRVEADVVLGTG